MTFKPAIWHPLAIILSVVNFAGAGYAIALAEPGHAAIHVGLGLAFGYWARRLRAGPAGSDRQTRFEQLEAEMDGLRQELGETQERLDFAERMLAQTRETHRVGPERREQ
jgi:hypothetical protein